MNNSSLALVVALYILSLAISRAADIPALSKTNTPTTATSTNPVPRTSFQTRLQQIVNRAKLESLESSSGRVLIKRYSDLGSVGTGTRVTVTCVQLTATTTNQTVVEYGVQVTVSRGAKSPDTGISYIDFDEIASLLKGIDSISQMEMSPAPLRSFEAAYRAIGGLRISVFPSGAGKWEATVESGRDQPVTARLSAAELAKFRALLESAKSTLDSPRQDKRQ